LHENRATYSFDAGAHLMGAGQALSGLHQARGCKGFGSPIIGSSVNEAHCLPDALCKLIWLRRGTAFLEYAASVTCGTSGLRTKKNQTMQLCWAQRRIHNHANHIMSE